MHYSNIRSRAGLVALVFTLINSLVSAVPIPPAECGLSSTLSLRSNPSLNGQPEVDTAKFQISRLPTDTRALTRRQDISTDMDDQLVRRDSVGSKNAKLPPKLQNAMNAMNMANKIMGYIPRRRDLLEEEAFEQRDISEAYSSFEERDDIALDNREESYFETNERDINERYDLD